MDRHSQRMLLPHPSISESIELTDTPTSSLQLRSHRRAPRDGQNGSRNNKSPKIGSKVSTNKSSKSAFSEGNFSAKSSLNHNNSHHHQQSCSRGSSRSNGSLFFCAYIFWTLISLISSFIGLVALWIPYWIQGVYFEGIHASFGPFRRCNYPTIDNQTGQLTIVSGCSKYNSFTNIPSLAWQLSTIFAGSSVLLSFFVTFVLLVSCCWYMSSKNANLIIKLQLLSILCIISSCFAFPFGMTVPEVLNVCGPVRIPVDFGTCQLSHSVYLIVASLLTSLISVMFGGFSSRILKIREHQRLQIDEFI